MIQVKNIHRNKKLFFEILGKPIGIGPGEVISVGDEIGKIMLESPYIINNLVGDYPKYFEEEKIEKKIIEKPKSPELPEIPKIKESIKKKPEKVLEDKKIRFKKVEKNNLKETK